jgi:hypothetical protein
LRQAKFIVKKSVNKIKKLTVNEGIQLEKVNACRICIELLNPKQEANTVEKPKTRTAQTQMQGTAS